MVCLGILVVKSYNPDWKIYENIFYRNFDNQVNKGDLLFVQINSFFRKIGFNYLWFRYLLLGCFVAFSIYLLNFTKFREVQEGIKICFFLSFVYIRFIIQIREGVAFSIVILFLLALFNKKSPPPNIYLLFLAIVATLIHTGLLFILAIYITCIILQKFELQKKLSQNKVWFIAIAVFCTFLILVTPKLSNNIYLLKTQWQQQPIVFSFYKTLFWLVNSIAFYFLVSQVHKIGVNSNNIQHLFTKIITYFFAPLILLWIIYLISFGGSQSLVAALYRLHFLNSAIIAFVLLINQKETSIGMYLFLAYNFIISVRTVIVSLQS